MERGRQGVAGCGGQHGRCIIAQCAAARHMLRSAALRCPMLCDVAGATACCAALPRVLFCSAARHTPTCPLGASQPSLTSSPSSSPSLWNCSQRTSVQYDSTSASLSLICAQVGRWAGARGRCVCVEPHGRQQQQRQRQLRGSCAALSRGAGVVSRVAAPAPTPPATTLLQLPTRAGESTCCCAAAHPATHRLLLHRIAQRNHPKVRHARGHLVGLRSRRRLALSCTRTQREAGQRAAGGEHDAAGGSSTERCAPPAPMEAARCRVAGAGARPARGIGTQSGQRARRAEQHSSTCLVLRRLCLAVDHLGALVVQRGVQPIVLLLQSTPLLPAGGWGARERRQQQQKRVIKPGGGRPARRLSQDRGERWTGAPRARLPHPALPATIGAAAASARGITRKHTCTARTARPAPRPAQPGIRCGCAQEPAGSPRTQTTGPPSCSGIAARGGEWGGQGAAGAAACGGRAKPLNCNRLGRPVEMRIGYPGGVEGAGAAQVAGKLRQPRATEGRWRAAGSGSGSPAAAQAARVSPAALQPAGCCRWPSTV